MKKNTAYDTMTPFDKCEFSTRIFAWGLKQSITMAKQLNLPKGCFPVINNNLCKNSISAIQ
jgi:hypothetical protein